VTEREQIPHRTPCTKPDFLDALVDLWPTHVGSPLCVPALAMVGGMWALETGSGQSCICWNVGNIKYRPGCDRDFTRFHTFEFIGGVRKDMVDTFRAYATLKDGLDDYLELLKKRKNFRPAFEVLRSASPTVHAFVTALDEGHYFTAARDVYEHGVDQLSRGFLSFADNAVNHPELRPAAVALRPIPPPFQEHGLQLGDDSPANPIRAGEGDDPDFAHTPILLDRDDDEETSS